MDNTQNIYPTTPLPIDDQERPRLPKRLKMGAIVVAASLALAGIIYLILTPQDQNLENQEASLEYAGTESPVTGIQFLLDYGLTFDQYKAVFSDLTDTFGKVNPDAKYFDYVADSLTFEESAAQKSADLSESDRTEIMAKVAANGDHTATIYYDDGTDESYDEKSEEAGDVIVFKMAADSGEEYTVKVTPKNDMKSASTEILNSAGEKIN